MAEHAVASGWPLLAGLAVACRTAARTGEGAERLLRAHPLLARLVAPARPETLVLFAGHRDDGGLRSRLGPIPFVRRMTLAALVGTAACILLAVAAALLPEGRAQRLAHPPGVLLFCAGAAALGASCAALARARPHLEDRSWDPRRETGYHARWLAGIAAGVSLGVAAVSGGGFRPAALAHGFLPAAAGGLAAPVLCRAAWRLAGAAGGLVRPSGRRAAQAARALARARAHREVTGGCAPLRPDPATPSERRNHAP